MRVHKAVIPAAGLGTRFLPATRAVPKEMLPIVDVPTIQLVVEEALAAGIGDIVVVNGRGKGAIEDHFDHAFELEATLEARGQKDQLERARRISTAARILSVRQKQPLGLGHAVLCARPAVGDAPFAVLLGDDLIDNDDDPGIAQLIRVYERTGAGAVAVMEVPDDQTHRYGIVDGERADDGTIRVRRLIEKPAPGTAPTNLAVIGRYVLPPKIWPLLEATRPGAIGEIQLTDALDALARDEPGLIGVTLRGTRHDAGDKLGFLRANLAYALKRPELAKGVRAMLAELSG